MSALDRLIESVAPQRALRREKARAQITALRRAVETAKGYYDGADMGRRGSSIRRSIASANTVSRVTLPSLRAGSQDLIRNNPYAARAVQVVQNNVVGPGIKLTFRKADGTPAEEVQAFAQPYLEGTKIDRARQLTYYAQQDLACRGMFSAGEVLAVRYLEQDGFSIRLVEGDHLDHTRDGISLRGDGSRVVQGVEYSAQGRPVAYWIFPEHPGEARLSVASQRVPAEDVIHLYRVDRPGQVRGIPWLAPVLLRMQDFADYEEAQLVLQKIAACLAVFVSDPVGSGTPGNQNTLPEDVEPGMIQQLNPGAEVTVASPPNVSGYGDYANVSIRAIAVGTGVPYTSLSEDLRGVNFSAGRLGKIEFRRNIQRWQWHTAVPMFCQRVADWILEEAEFRGVDTRGVVAQHTPPAMEMVDPTREIPANILAIRSGQKTLSQIAQESGRDVRTLVREIKRDLELLDSEEIVLDSDPRRTTGAGILQVPPEESDS